MKTLILTIGLPRSGKTTWAKSTGLPIVNRDAIRLALHGQPFLLEAEPIITAIEDYMVKSLLLAGNDTIIIDATHLKVEYIERWKKIKDVKLKFKVFITPWQTCIQRAVDTDKLYLIPIIMNMVKDFENLLETIGFLSQRNENEKPL